MNIHNIRIIKNSFLYNVTTPSLGSKGHAASSVFQGKMKKYNGKALESGFNFQPIILQSSGLISVESLSYIKSLASLASRIRKISKVVLFSYFLKRISLALQRGIADSINKRYLLINAHYPIEDDPSFQENLIYDS